MKETQSRYQHLYNLAIDQFTHVVRLYWRFHVLSILVLAIQFCVVCAIGWFEGVSYSFGIALLSHSFFGFTYILLMLYFRVKKPEQLADLRDHFIASCQKECAYKEEHVPSHRLLAKHLEGLASQLDGVENQMQSRMPRFLYPLRWCIAPWSRWRYHCDGIVFRTLLLLSAIEEHIKRIKLIPTSMPVHASLAFSYRMLAMLYRDQIPFPLPFFSNNEGHHFTDRFLRRAIEEYKILEVYAPSEPWVLQQLAQCYQEMDDGEQEIHYLEKALRLIADDPENLFRLGTLYFQKGYPARGLEVYKTLKRLNYGKSERLLAFYASSLPIDLDALE